MKYTGTISRGVKAPIIREGDDIVEVVVESLKKLVNEDNVTLDDNDVVCITESIVAVAQGNFASKTDIAKDISSKFSNGPVGVLFPIMSRNRFATTLQAITEAVDEVVLQLSYPCDEVGNKFIEDDMLFKSGINPYTDVLTKKEFRKLFGTTKHKFTSVDYIELYQNIIGEKGNIILSNDPTTILKYTDQVFVSNVHERYETAKALQDNGVKTLILLEDIMKNSINGSGYNQDYGLLGCNLSQDGVVKLFPRDSENIVLQVQKRLKKEFNKHIEVMIYGDGALKDPTAGIWELCDPVVSPGFTKGLIGTPQEVKLKYLAANELGHLSDDKLEAELKAIIKEQDKENKNKMASQGTTPRQITDILGTLADLTSGSGDKGTPIVLIQNFFKNYAS